MLHFVAQISRSSRTRSSCSFWTRCWITGISPNCGACRSTSFTVVENQIWRQDSVQLPSVKVVQEVSNWERAAEIGMGAVVWPAALAFCKFVDSECGPVETGMGGARGFWSGLRVLELGAGCGAAGLELAARNAEVTLTDRDSVLPLLERNVGLNPHVSARVRLLRWEDVTRDDFFISVSAESSDLRGFDVVLSTDLVDVDPDRGSGSDIFASLRNVLRTGFETLPQALFIFIFEERGPLHLEGLADLFAPLLSHGTFWEFVPALPADPRPRRCSPSLRFLCGHGAAANASEPPIFLAWRSHLEGKGVFQLQKLTLDTFSVRS